MSESKYSTLKDAFLNREIFKVSSDDNFSLDFSNILRSPTKQESPQMLNRLIDWNADVLLKLLKKVVSKRESMGTCGGWDDDPIIETSSNIIEERVDVIRFPSFQHSSIKPSEVAPQVEQQLKEYVRSIAQAYRSNAYHCLQHASHTTMSATKLISRIAVSDFESGHEFEGGDALDSEELLAQHIHTQTYGLSSDPLTQFAAVLAALIHAVDHRGISNADLVVEEPGVAARYGEKFLTEQLSFEKAWGKLMTDDFENLRRCIYANEEEKKRFRQVMVNSILATNHEDEEAQMKRQERWELSFGPTALENDLNRKATSVVEALMQA